MAGDDSNPCRYSDVLATVLALVGREVEVTVTAGACASRQLLCARGRLAAGPELGADEDALIPIAVGEVELALKRGWIEGAWREATSDSLALLFKGGVLVEIDRVAEADRA